MTNLHLEGSLRKTLRLVLNLGKYQVIERNHDSIVVSLGGTTRMTIAIPPNVDVNAGDILTFYTEVPYSANTLQPPI